MIRKIFCLSYLLGVIIGQIGAQDRRSERGGLRQTDSTFVSRRIEQVDEREAEAFKNYADSLFTSAENRRGARDRKRQALASKEQGLAEYVGVNTKAYADSIVVRWAPSSRKLWLKGKSSGYTLIRYETKVNHMNERHLDSLIRHNIPLPNSFLLPSIEKIIASADEPIFPYDSAKWADHFPNEDQYALVAAGATLDALEVSNNVGFALKGQQDKSIFGMVLLSADFSRLAANGLGFRYVDKDVKIGFTYTYEVKLADSLSQIPFDQLDSAQQFQRFRQGMNSSRTNRPVEFIGEYIPKKVTNISATSMDKRILLEWPTLGNSFTGYIVEKSSDGGKTFTALTERPFMTPPVSLQDSIGLYLSPVYQFKDSVSRNYYTYYYRISGIDAFADKTEPVIIKASAKDLTPPPNPLIISGEFLENRGEIRLTYKFPEVPLDHKALYFEYAYHVDSTFVRYESESLNPRDSVYHHVPEPDEQSHYVRMVAEDTASNKSFSFPIFVNIPDTIPPPQPTGLTGKIDSTGQVHLHWHDFHLSEKGFLGYRVYYSNHPNHEFTQLTVKPVNSNFYIYHIPLKVLTDIIYYKIQAVDNSYNHSTFSEILEIKKPDVLSPVTPVFNYPSASEFSINLSWIPSSSKDVVKQVLTRINTSDQESTTYSLAAETNSFMDSLALVGIIYEYNLKALDDAGLWSNQSFPVRAKKVDKKKMPSISNIEAELDTDTKTISLTWDYQQPNDEFQFVIYKNKDTDKVKKYRMTLQRERAFTEKLNNAGIYYYGVRVISKSGARSSMSEIVSVKLK